MGWYSEGQVTIDSSSPNFEGNLIGVVYYNELNSDKVLIQIRGNKDYYVAFNHKAKVNSLPLEGANLVMITSKIKSPYSSGDSNLEARLDEGDSFIVEGTYEIKVIEINKSTDRYYAKLKIGAENCTADSDCDNSNDECIYSRCSWDGLCVRELDCHNCGKTSVLVEVVTDHYPERTSWSIEKDGTTLSENDPFHYKFAMYNKRVCLGVGKFKFKMKMSGKDVCCPNTREGYYALSKGNVVLNQDILSNKKKKVINFSI